MLGRISSIERLRTAVDGDGITTLVVMNGCPLHCEYCINDFCHNALEYNCSPEELYAKVKIDGIYFMMSGGGITFGGGEPLLQAEFINEFSKLCPKGWKIRIETSLNVEWKSVEILIPVINQWIIDIKDINSHIYEAYTGCTNVQMLENLDKLYNAAGAAKLHLRIPLIPEYNNDGDIENTMKYLKRYDCEKERFEYKL